MRAMAIIIQRIICLRNGVVPEARPHIGNQIRMCVIYAGINNSHHSAGTPRGQIPDGRGCYLRHSPLRYEIGIIGDHL